MLWKDLIKMGFMNVRGVQRYIGKSLCYNYLFYRSLLKARSTGRWDTELCGSEDLSFVLKTE